MVQVRRVASEDFGEGADAALDLIVAACRAGDGRDPLDEASHLQLRHHGLEGSGLWLAPAGDAPQGFAFARSGLAGIELDLAVSPEARGQGIGSALLEAAQAAEASLRSRRDVASLTPRRRFVRAWSHGDHPAAAALAAAYGFARVRELMVLRRPVAAEDRGAPADPRIRGYRDSDAGELLRVNAQAFADHPEQGAMDATGLAERMAEPWFDPAGLLVATDPADSGRLLGFHWTKLHGGDQGGHGEVYVLAVDPAAQGLGLGRSLTAAGLRHLAERGAHSVHLYVEASNAGALALYRGQGFEPDHTHVQYQRG